MRACNWFRPCRENGMKLEQNEAKLVVLEQKIRELDAKYRTICAPCRPNDPEGIR